MVSVRSSLGRGEWKGMALAFSLCLSALAERYLNPSRCMLSVHCVDLTNGQCFSVLFLLCLTNRMRRTNSLLQIFGFRW